MTVTTTTEPLAPHWRQHDGQWMICLLADEAEPGCEIEVLKKDGTVQLVTLAEVGPAERNFDGDMVVYATVVPRTSSPRQRGLLRHLAGRVAEAGDAGMATDLDAAADDELLPMDKASELISTAKSVLGDEVAPS